MVTDRLHPGTFAYIMSIKTRMTRNYATYLHSVQKAAVGGGEDESVVSTYMLTKLTPPDLCMLTIVKYRRVELDHLFASDSAQDCHDSRYLLSFL